MIEVLCVIINQIKMKSKLITLSVLFTSFIYSQEKPQDQKTLDSIKKKVTTIEEVTITTQKNS